MAQTSASASAISKQQLQAIADLAQNLKFGAITLTFQDGRLVQIDKNEKIRMTKHN